MPRQSKQGGWSLRFTCAQSTPSPSARGIRGYTHIHTPTHERGKKSRPSSLWFLEGESCAVHHVVHARHYVVCFHIDCWEHSDQGRRQLRLCPEPLDARSRETKLWARVRIKQKPMAPSRRVIRGPSTTVGIFRRQESHHLHPSGGRGDGVNRHVQRSP